MDISLPRKSNTLIARIAKAGLIAKGIVYVTLGILGFMAAFELGSQSDGEAGRNGVFKFIKDSPGGGWLLGLLAAGLVCYSLWRFIQSFRKEDGGKEIKPAKRVRYFLSGLAYLAVAFSAIKMDLGAGGSKGDQNQQMAGELLSKPFGQWLVGIAALILAAIGIYQVFYGLSEKYKKHVEGMSTHSKASSILLSAGKTGYVARGIVWLIVAFLGLKAALHSNASEAGDTAKAFQFLESSSYGSYLLGALGIGLMAYGVFNFIRARYERFS